MINMFVYHCIEHYNELFVKISLAIGSSLSSLSLNQSPTSYLAAGSTIG